ncbi:MAG: serine/threonine-protein kinase [Gemmataceae bacterium]|nr:serine/threonine-protein kinase [Gemmataceae bacterium]
MADALRDRYALDRELGRGGMAAVYLARDLKHDRLVALKVLHAELAATLGPERFQHEIKLAARLQHPHILSVHDSGEAAGRLWFTMPYVEGESLRDRLRRERQLPVEDALRITREAALALDYAHRHDVIHRDVKPENILLLSDGSTLVTDFGIARALGGATEHLTQTGMVVGTPAYMSPEQAAGDAALDPRTDIYSLGCVLYEMLAGEPPFTGPTAQAVIAKRLQGAAPGIGRVRPSVPREVEQALTRALALVPADRFPNMAEFSRSLSVLGPTVPVAAAVPAGPRNTWHRFALRSAGAITILALGFLGLRLAGLLGGSSLVAEGALAAQDQLVLAEFADRANDSTLAAAVTEAFRVDFSQSRLVGLASADRIQASLRRMQRPDTSRLTAATGREVALREGFKAVLVGEVGRLGDGYVISARLLGADSGQVLAGYRETAGSASEIIPAVDRLSRTLRRRIGESLGKIRANPPLAAVTTGSLDALRQYSLGLRAHRTGRYEDALTLYQSATRLDSTFGMAWQGVATALWNLRRDPGRQQDALTRAYALRDRLPERERYSTEARYFEEVLGDTPKAREAYRALLALDPENAAALTNLGLMAWFDGDLDEASEMAARAIRADSGSIPAYTNLVDAQVSQGDFAPAETTLARWRARFGSHAHYDIQVGLMASARGEYDSAARAFRRALRPGEPVSDRARGAGLLAETERTRGRLAEARRLDRLSAQLDGTGIAALRPVLNDGWTALYLGAGRERAVQRLDSLMAGPGYAALEVTSRPFDEIAYLYAMGGQPDRAAEVFASGKRALELAGPAGASLLRQRWHRMMSDAVQAAILLQRGRSPEAAAAFRRSRTAFGYTNWLPEIGTALDRAGATDSALAVYQEYLGSTFNFRIFGDPYNLGPVLRRTGELYEAHGDRRRAAATYQRFVDLWRNADPELQPQVVEVKRRLAGLTEEPR